MISPESAWFLLKMIAAVAIIIGGIELALNYIDRKPRV